MLISKKPPRIPYLNVPIATKTSTKFGLRAKDWAWPVKSASSCARTVAPCWLMAPGDGRTNFNKTLITNGKWFHISIMWNDYYRALNVNVINMAPDEKNTSVGRQSNSTSARCYFLGYNLFSGLID